jgi:hypothetical protein
MAPLSSVARWSHWCTSAAHRRSGASVRTRAVDQELGRSGRARGAQSAAAREPPAQSRVRDPVESRGLVRSGVQRDPTEGFRFVGRNQAVPTTFRPGVSSSGYSAKLPSPL